jgi:hypothetical protein
MMPEEEIDALIGELKTYLDERDLSKAGVAKMLGISRQRLHNWLQGAEPDVRGFLKLRAFLKAQKRRKKRGLGSNGT